jgi:hypothetical protein
VSKRLFAIGAVRFQRDSVSEKHDHRMFPEVTLVPSAPSALSAVAFAFDFLRVSASLR